MQFLASSIVVLAVFSAVFADVHFEERFQDGSYRFFFSLSAFK